MPKNGLIRLSEDSLLRSYNTKEFCARAGISEKTLERLLARGEVKTANETRSGVSRRFTALELASFLYGAENIVVGGDI